MQPKKATPQKENALSSKAVMSLTPILRLPVELRDTIYSHVISQAPWPSQRTVRCSCDDNPVASKRCSWHGEIRAHGRLAYRGSLDQLTHRQEAFLPSEKINTNWYQLIYTSPLSRANRQLREDFSRYLRSAPMRIITKVHNYDFQHVIHFLLTLNEPQRDAFKVRPDGTSARTLIIELHGPYTDACLENLQNWVDQVRAFAGPGKHAELASLYKTGPVSKLNFMFKYANNPLVRVHQKLGESIAPGGGAIEAWKILLTLNASDILRTHFDWWLRWGNNFQYSVDEL